MSSFDGKTIVFKTEEILFNRKLYHMIPENEKIKKQNKYHFAG